ncbi:MAG: hypothetical protein ACYC6R_14635 [Anaerolineales bacterium]
MQKHIETGIRHSHTFSEDARVLIMESRDTVAENSPFVPLSGSQWKESLAKTLKVFFAY